MHLISRTKISELNCPYLKDLVAEICELVRATPSNFPEHSIHDLLSIVFPKHKISQRDTSPIPGAILPSKMEKIAGSPLYDLARELASQRPRIQLGAYDGKTFLTFLKDCYPAEKKIQRIR